MTVANLDVPGGADLEEIGCQEPWAVVDVDLNGGACPESGDGVPSCAPARMRRFFLRIEGSAWTQFGSWHEAGCEGVQGSVPAFPTELCEVLPALP